MNHYTLLTEIGEGAYAKVYSAVDKNEVSCAIKQLKTTHEGIPSLVEIGIMTTILHPNLCHAKHVFTTNKMVNIVQERAICDLKSHTRGQLFDLDLVRKWLYQVTQAVGVLHYFGIVHADIKGGNVLYFNDNDVRLGDFSLSVMKVGIEMCKGLACTYSHSPPESLQGEPWNESLDIWSLACLYYEVAFGSLLFPNQGKEKDKKELKKKYYNCIADWKGMGTLGSGDNFRNVSLHPCYHLDEYKVLTELIQNMLIFDQHQRPNISTVLHHPFFTGYRAIPAQIKEIVLKNNNPDLTIYEQLLEPSRDLYTYRWNRVVKLAAHIYECLEKRKKKDRYRIAACWIAGKIMCRIPPSLKTLVTQQSIVKMETIICGSIGFCFPLHTE